MSDISILLNDAGYRRRWLLTKALEENDSLAKALQMAQAAEDFLFSTVSRAPNADWAEEAAALLSPPETREITTAPDAFDALLSVVSVDELLRYLQQNGANVVAETGGRFLVDGCFSENAEDLLVRANLSRTQQGLPPFAILPGFGDGKAGEQHKSAPAAKADGPKRPPSAKERADWAWKVMTLPA